MRGLAGVLATIVTAGCSAAPPPEPGTAAADYRWGVSAGQPAPARSTGTAAPGASPGTPDALPSSDPIEDYLAANPSVSARVREALRARNLVAGGGGMTAEQVLLIVPRASIVSTGVRDIVWYEDTTPQADRFDYWELDRYQRWQFLFFNGGRLRGWIEWNGPHVYRFPD